MCFRQNNRVAGGQLPAFTLIEVMLAVAITGLVAFGILRVVDASLRALRVSAELSSRDVSMRALMNIIQEQLNALPQSPQGMQQKALWGEAHKFNNLPSDEITWVCSAGLGLFTIHAIGDYNVTMTLKQAKDSPMFDLGVRRVMADGSNKDENWLTLMKAVKALEIRYFDQRVNAWLEKWTDQVARPNLVRVRIWRAGDEQPYEQIFNLPPIS